MKRAMRSGVDTTAAFLRLVNTKAEFYKVDLLQIQLPELGYPTPLTLRYALGDVDIPFEGLTWSAREAKWERSTTKVVIGTEADTMALTCAATRADLLPPADATQPAQRLPIPEAFAAGIFQDAVVTLRTLFAPAPPHPLDGFDDSAGAVTMSAGRIREWELQRGSIKCKVYSWAEALDVPMPRNLYQPSCLNTLYDGICGASRTGVTPPGGFGQPSTPLYAETTVWAYTFGVGDARNAGELLVPPLDPGQAAETHLGDHFFELGTVQIRSGLLAGLTRQIKTQVNGVAGGAAFILQQPLPRAPLIGTPIHLQAGCNKTLETCASKFNRLPGFRGAPWIPPADNAF